jgi:hypothetical protein
MLNVKLPHTSWVGLERLFETMFIQPFVLWASGALVVFAAIILLVANHLKVGRQRLIQSTLVEDDTGSLATKELGTIKQPISANVGIVEVTEDAAALAIQQLYNRLDASYAAQLAEPAADSPAETRTAPHHCQSPV